MWVFTKHGFFSIVQDKDDENYLIVRARVKGDLEELLGGTNGFQDQYPIQEDTGSDYRYRIRADREIVAELVCEETLSIDYTNYKAAVNMVDQRRSEYYGMVWAIMADMQDHFNNPEE